MLCRGKVHNNSKSEEIYENIHGTTGVAFSMLPTSRDFHVCIIPKVISTQETYPDDWGIIILAQNNVTTWKISMEKLET